MFHRTGVTWGLEGILDPAGQGATTPLSDVACDAGRVLISTLDYSIYSANGAVFAYQRTPSGWLPGGDLEPAGSGVVRFASSVDVQGDTAVATTLGFSSVSDTVHAFSISTDFPSLFGDVASVSMAAGGSQALRLRGCLELAGAPFVFLGSLGGTFALPLPNGGTLPLFPDGYFIYTLQHPPAFLSDPVGLLDAGARAETRFDLPPGALSGLAGTTITHAYLSVPATPEDFFLFGSSAVSVTLAP